MPLGRQGVKAVVTRWECQCVRDEDMAMLVAYNNNLVHDNRNVSKENGQFKSNLILFITSLMF